MNNGTIGIWMGGLPDNQVQVIMVKEPIGTVAHVIEVADLLQIDHSELMAKDLKEQGVVIWHGPELLAGPSIMVQTEPNAPMPQSMIDTINQALAK